VSAVHTGFHGIQTAGSAVGHKGNRHRRWSYPKNRFSGGALGVEDVRRVCLSRHMTLEDERYLAEALLDAWAEFESMG
jgi:hypothetical protein